MSHKANVLQVIGYRNSGKTTLICRLVRKLTEEGFRVGTVKHDAHRFEMDYPGKDTWQHRMAGAETVAITSKEQTAMIRQWHTPLDDLLHEMRDHDIVLIEGFKFAHYPKIVIVRTKDQLPLLNKAEKILAVVSWFSIQATAAPVYDIDNFTGVYTQLLKFMKEEGLT